MPKTFRILILGSGFSKPAGLPLGSELFGEVRKLIRHDHSSNSVESDIKRYKEYVAATEGRKITDDSLDYEKFLGFLDTEHFLGFDGGDRLSDEGNASQLRVRRAIAEILYRRTPKTPPALYRSFVRKLNPSDWVLTFNYDTLLESALDVEEIPYRRYPHRSSKNCWGHNEVDESKEEVVVLKLHGSIDWYDRTVYERKMEARRRCSIKYEDKDLVFGENRVVEPVQITDGPRSKDDYLAKIYRVPNLEPLLDSDVWKRRFWECCPLILSPSESKLFYSWPLRDLWNGIGEMGGLNLSICVVGYSLPTYDEYARQAFYRMFLNYKDQPNLEFQGRKKTPIRILDYNPTDKSGADIRGRYRFTDWSRTELNLEGLNESTIEWLFNEDEELKSPA